MSWAYLGVAGVEVDLVARQLESTRLRRPSDDVVEPVAVLGEDEATADTPLSVLAAARPAPALRRVPSPVALFKVMVMPLVHAEPVARTLASRGGRPT